MAITVSLFSVRLVDDADASSSGWILAPCMSTRHAAAAEWLLANDAAFSRQLRRAAPNSLSWTYDPRPGHEHKHDRMLDRVLPLLLSLRIEDKLYRYQRSGVAWLLLHDSAILADDMGLGKTVQVVTAVRRLYRHNRISSCLVVAPRTLISNWITEVGAWAPELLVERLKFKNRTFSRADWRAARIRSHVLVASYEDLRGLWDDLEGQPPDLIVADEAHRLRKSESLAHQAMRRIRPPRLWALTGTPVERNADDLAGLLSLIAPSRFAVDDSRHGLATLRGRARPFLLRRTKSDALPDLPGAKEHIEQIDLHPAQRSAYQAAVSAAQRSPGDGHLKLFNTLRSICDIDVATGASSKLDRAEQLIDEARESRRKTVVFSYRLEPLRALLRRLRTRFDGASELLVGQQSVAERNDVIERFKTDPACYALLASMRVGGEGLTLTEATQVIFINRWWNPSANAQAVDRVVRIGQTEQVDVHYLVTVDTVEDRLEPLLTRKKMTFSQLVDALRRDPAAAQELMDVG